MFAAFPGNRRCELKKQFILIFFQFVGWGAQPGPMGREGHASSREFKKRNMWRWSRFQRHNLVVFFF